MTAQTDNSVKKLKSKLVATSIEKETTRVEKPAKKIATKSIDKAVAKPDNLLREIVEARKRWLVIFKENSIETKSYKKKDSERSKKKIIYFVRPSISKPWWSKMKKELDELNTRLIKYQEKQGSVKRSLWLPTIIDNPKQITVKTYTAKNSVIAPFEKAKKFAEKAGLTKKKLDEMTEDQEFRMDYFTGRNYKLSVLKDNVLQDYTFTDWAICIYRREEIPKIRRKNIPYTPRKNNSKKLICKNNKSALFVKVSKVTE